MLCLGVKQSEYFSATALSTCPALNHYNEQTTDSKLGRTNIGALL